MHSRLFTLFLVCVLATMTFAAPWGQPNRGNGQATYYSPGLGACGYYNSPSDLIAAVAVGRGKGECGKQVVVSRGSKSVTVTITDLCQACGPDDIDLTTTAFRKIGSLSEGRINIAWSYRVSASAGTGPAGPAAGAGAGAQAGDQ